MNSNLMNIILSVLFSFDAGFTFGSWMHSFNAGLFMATCMWVAFYFRFDGEEQ